ncbi:MAG TPA: NUDIX hydrolase [Patescibacteria group bacterium]|nr:NUDIX hydrolase [Patescibacteria group bacterium]
MNEPCFYRVSVKALVTDSSGSFLLAKENGGTWDFLGGGLDHDEDPVAALKREITEETGLVVVGVLTKPAYFVTAKKPDMDVFIANVFYRVMVKNLDFRPSDECQELRYFSVEEAQIEKLLPNVIEFLKVYTPMVSA